MAHTYRFRLESQDDSGHYRQGVISADSEAEARQFLESREQEYALYRLDTDELKQADENRDRAKLALHNQAEPYKLVSLKKEG